MDVDLDKIQSMANWLQKQPFSQHISIANWSEDHIKTLSFMIGFGWCKNVGYNKEDKTIIKTN